MPTCEYHTGVDRHTQRFTFPSYEVMFARNLSVGDIKDAIARVNFVREAANHLNRNDHEDYADWLALVQVFISRWGKAFVPLDIRFALRDVQESLGLPLTPFP